MCVGLADRWRGGMEKEEPEPIQCVLLHISLVGSWIYNLVRNVNLIFGEYAKVSLAKQNSQQQAEDDMGMSDSGVRICCDSFRCCCCFSCCCCCYQNSKCCWICRQRMCFQFNGDRRVWLWIKLNWGGIPKVTLFCPQKAIRNGLETGTSAHFNFA